jgi:predicted CopG family antitoxin
MKQLNITILDDAHEKLEDIKRAKGMNNAEVMEFLIDEVHKALFPR